MTESAPQDIDTVPLPEIGPETAESWVQLLPSGTFDLRDKRGPWVVKDMAAVIAASRAEVARGMPVDMDHALDRPTMTEAPAAGWIEELEARDNGIWARIAWTNTGKALIAGREYRFISPVVMVTKQGEVKAIKRAGLTNNPAISMKAICRAEEGEAEIAPASPELPPLAELCSVLGAPVGATVDQLTTCARAIVAAATTAQTGGEAETQLASLRAEIHRGRVDAALERARASGKLVPAMEEWAVELASANITSFEAWEACALPLVNLGGPKLAGRVPPPELLTHGKGSTNAERLAVCAQLGIEPEQNV